MNTHRLSLALIAAFYLFLVKPQLSLAAPTSLSFPDYRQQIVSPDAAVRQQAAQQILQNQHSLELILQQTAEDAITEENKRVSAEETSGKSATSSEVIVLQQKTAAGVSAVELLGDLRAEDAIPFLIKNLLFHNPKVELGRNPLDAAFPCYGALAKIGLPALNPLLEQASKTNREVYQRVSVSLVFEVLGPKLAPVYLQDKITQQKNSEQRKRLESMASFMKTPPTE